MSNKPLNCQEARRIYGQTDDRAHAADPRCRSLANDGYRHGVAARGKDKLMDQARRRFEEALAEAAHAHNEEARHDASTYYRAFSDAFNKTLLDLPFPDAENGKEES